MKIPSVLTAGRLGATLLLGFAVGFACDHGSVCDPGPVLSDNQCVAAPASGGSTFGGGFCPRRVRGNG